MPATLIPSAIEDPALLWLAALLPKLLSGEGRLRTAVVDRVDGMSDA